MPVQPAAGVPPADNLLQNPPIPPGEKRLIDFIKVPAEELFSGLSQILFLASVVVVVGISIFFLGIPGFQKGAPAGSSPQKVGAFAPPINVADINFPSEFQQDIFLKNFQDAGKTSDYQQRYKLLADNYSRLLGFYTGDHDAKTRKVLEQYAQYMISYYPERAQESIYTVPCFDSGCGTAKYPEEIKRIKDEIGANEAINKEVKNGMLRNLEGAAYSSDKYDQFATYLGVLSILKVEYGQTGDSGIKSIYDKLLGFMKNDFPDLSIPNAARI